MAGANRWVWAATILAVAAGGAGAAGAPREYRDPEVTIPWCARAPKLDGALSPGEWDFAAGVGMLEAYPYRWPRAMRQEQAVFRVFRDDRYLYVAIESLDSSTTGITASCVMHDNLRIIGDDCAELMIAPGAGERIKEYDFPTYYFALNSIGTIWDCRFVPLLNESHNSWESGIEVANGVEGTHWVCEARIPLANIRRNPPAEGEVWRMNFDRTYAGYHWSAWNAGGGLNDCRVGGNARFDRNAPAIRVRSADDLADGRMKVVMEVANGTDAPRTVKMELAVAGDGEAGPVPVGRDGKTVTVKPGGVEEVVLGRGQKLCASNVAVLTVSDEAGRTLYFVERQVNVPAPRFVKTVAPKVPLVHVFPRFLPSLERLAVEVDCTAWARKTGVSGVSPTAGIRVWPKGGEAGRPVMEGRLTEFVNNRAVWRGTTTKLPEGDYVVKVNVAAGGTTLVEHDDWFEKRIFDWMRKPAGTGEAVPAPYTPLEARNRTVAPWGRSYTFADTGLPRSMVSQGRELLAGEAALLVEAGKRSSPLEVSRPFAFTGTKPAEVRGRAALRGAGLKVDLETVAEYDGFVLFRMTYGPEKGRAALDRLRLRLPIAGKHALFYSAAGDTQGTCVQGDVLPAKQGKVFDSMENTRSVCCSPTFATLFWTGDRDVCLCYAADSDKGWIVRDDAPAVEAWREGGSVVLWLNLVDRPSVLTGPRTLEFALQAGPTKPLPDGWRGIQDNSCPTGAPTPLALAGGSGNAMPGGGQCFIHPGATPEERERSGKYLQGFLSRGAKAVIGYTYWPKVPKGFAETRVFRGEWGIDRRTWESATAPAVPVLWENRFFGPDRDRYVILDTGGRPSYVEFLTHAYDLALANTPILGTYDDCGYPVPVYDEELGLGFVREDGRRVWSSGLWTYRERWKRAAYVNFLHNRLNLLADSQHVHAHFMPAYHFIGIWRPCERGYYNFFKDRDNLGFYGSMDRYAAMNPSKAFGQFGQIGLSSPQTDGALKARDTRCMMMLTMLNDQDLWPRPYCDVDVAAGLRQARNRFRPWEKEVSFRGYWENADIVSSGSRDVLVSVYLRPGAALFVLGNTGEADVDVALAPVWAKLGLDPAGLAAVDAENDRPIPIAGGMTVRVARHDMRVVLVGRPDLFPARP